MVELSTEVSLAVLDLYLNKPPNQRTEKHKKLALEAAAVLSSKQEQFTPADADLVERFHRECM